MSKGERAIDWIQSRRLLHSANVIKQLYIIYVPI